MKLILSLNLFCSPGSKFNVHIFELCTFAHIKTLDLFIRLFNIIGYNNEKIKY